MMKKYTQEQLTASGYIIKNALITNVDLSMADHGCLTLAMTLEGGSWGVVYGAAGMEYLMRIMDTVGVEKFQELKGKYVRVATKGWGSSVKIIGNIINDKWFDAETFFTDKKEN